MDAIELTTLRQELLRDTEVAESALATAHERFAVVGPAQEEACAFHLCRLFNVVEQMALRVAKRFENSIDDPARWHAELIRRTDSVDDARHSRSPSSALPQGAGGSTRRATWVPPCVHSRL